VVLLDLRLTVAHIAASVHPMSSCEDTVIEKKSSPSVVVDLSIFRCFGKTIQ